MVGLRAEGGALQNPAIRGFFHHVDSLTQVKPLFGQHPGSTHQGEIPVDRREPDEFRAGSCNRRCGEVPRVHIDSPGKKLDLAWGKT